MDDDLAALRAFVFSDEDLAFVCAQVLTVLAHGERQVETIQFNELDVTVDRNRRSVAFQGVLSVNDEVFQLPEQRFVALASTIAEPLSGHELADWRQGRERHVWPMPPASE